MGWQCKKCLGVKIGDLVIVNNIKSASLTTCIPKIKNEILEIKRIILPDWTFSNYSFLPIFVVDFNEDEVYLYRHEFKIKRKQK